MVASILNTDIVVAGAGGCGLTAALVAAEYGRRVLVLERDTRVGGSTALSAGIFVAANSRLQQANGETGTPEELAEDIFRANGRQSDAAVTLTLCQASGPLLDWLVTQGVPLEHMPDYTYDGMSRSWLHSPPGRQGTVIVDVLFEEVQRRANVDLLLGTSVTGLTSENGAVTGLTLKTRKGEALVVQAQSVILATSGFGANRALVARYMPELADAPYFGSPHATGEGITWGQTLGAAVKHMGAYQTHSSIAYPDMMLVTTYLINHGAIQVNQYGRRFGDETDTYAGHALAVQRQPGQSVIEVFDDRILRRTLANYPRFGECMRAGIVRRADTLAELAKEFGLEAENLKATLASYNASVSKGRDEFGRVTFGEPLRTPFFGIRVTSALVQTLGGLQIDARARVLQTNGMQISGLYAGGGTAAGLAGNGAEGYLAGTGLLAAFGLGWIAGREAARETAKD